MFRRKLAVVQTGNRVATTIDEHKKEDDRTTEDRNSGNKIPVGQKARCSKWKQLPVLVRGAWST
jgi:hypothetical protein